MSIIGIDFGTSACVVATIQQHAISVVRNDLSERLTPSLVGFSDKERYIGELAQSYIKSNYKNTCRYLKQMLGLVAENEEDIAYERVFCLAPIDVTSPEEGSLACYLVNYEGQKQVFSGTRCVAALFAALKMMAERSLSSRVQDAVISVPVWYNERARKSILDAVKIAGLNCYRIMNEHAAIALDYGIYRSSTLDADKTYRVVFVGFGHGSAFVSIVDFMRGQLKVVACGYDKRLSGREIDYAIMAYLSKLFNISHPEIDSLQNPKARLKLEEASSRIKKILSANTEATYNVECLYEDYELNGLLTRQEFEQICEPFRERLAGLLKSTFEQNNLYITDVRSVELVGGCCRTPWVQKVIYEFFEKRLTLSKTLSMDETVARGCALQAAMLDQRYRVKEYSILDTISYPIHVSYYSMSSGESSPELKTNVLFDKYSVYGSKKWLTFSRSKDFQIQVQSAQPNSPLLCFNICLPEISLSSDLPKRVRVGVKLSMNGLIVVESAQLLVDEEIVAAETQSPLEATKGAKTNPIDSEVAQSHGANTADPEDLMSAPHNDQEAAQSETSDTSTNATVTQEKVAKADSQQTNAQQSVTGGASAQTVKQKKKIETHKFECKFYPEGQAGFVSDACLSSYCESEQKMFMSDQKQRQLRETINDLETYIYKMRDSLRRELKDFCTAEELDRCMEVLQNTENWIYDFTDHSTTLDQYNDKLYCAKEVCEPISSRQVSYDCCQEALQSLAGIISTIKAKLTPEVIRTEWSHVPTDKVTSLVSKVDEMERWFDQISKILESTPLYVEPSINANTINQEKEMLVNFTKTILVPKQAVIEESTKLKDDKSTEKTADQSPMQNGSQSDVEDGTSSNDTAPMSDEH